MNGMTLDSEQDIPDAFRVSGGAPRWRDFATVFPACYGMDRSHFRPLLSGEFGAVGEPLGTMARWFWRASLSWQTQFPGIEAIEAVVSVGPAGDLASQSPCLTKDFE